MTTSHDKQKLQIYTCIYKQISCRVFCATISSQSFVEKHRKAPFNISRTIFLVARICRPSGLLSNEKYRYNLYKCWTCAGLCEAWTFLMENIYVQFEGMLYQQVVGIPMDKTCAPLRADLFLYRYERDFLSNLLKYKQYGLIHMLNDISQYIDDILTIYNPEFGNIFMIYMQRNFNGTKQIPQT